MMKVNNDEIQNIVLDTTKKFIKEKGVKGFNMDELAAASGVAKNTLYKMIGSKEAIVFKALFDEFKKLDDQLENLMSRSIKKVQLEELSLFFTEMFTSTYGGYIKDILLEYPGNGRLLQEYMEEMRAKVIDHFKQRKALGDLREDLDVPVLFEILEGVTVQFIRSDYTGEALAERLIMAYDYILEGIKR